MSNYRQTFYDTATDDTVVCRPLEVKVENNFDRAMKAFRAIVQKEKVLSDYKESERYEKPSDRRRRKVQDAKRKRFEQEAKAARELEYRQRASKKSKEDR
jgi:small subunit ribosomal protein S21